MSKIPMGSPTSWEWVDCPGIIEPTSDSTGAKNWESEGPLEVCTIGADGQCYKVQSLVLGTAELSGTVITITLEMKVDGIVNTVYDQSFNRSAGHDPPGLWIINGTLGIHEALVVKLKSNSPGDNGKAVRYDYSLEPAGGG
ncbi:hypothetical protein ES703_66204 [subsurface metagenome]